VVVVIIDVLLKGRLVVVIIDVLLNGRLVVAEIVKCSSIQPSSTVAPSLKTYSPQYGSSDELHLGSEPEYAQQTEYSPADLSCNAASGWPYSVVKYRCYRRLV